MKLLLSMFAYPFIVRAFVVGILVSLCASLLGVPLVLKRYSMIGDGLSHVSFGALSVAVACGFAPLWFSIPVVVIAAFILMHVAEKSRVSADAMIAVFSASALAIGVIVTSLTTGMTTDVDSYMFGSILAMSRSDVIFRSRSEDTVRVAMMAGTEQPKPMSMGTMLRPERPIFRRGLSMTKATRAM